MKTNESVGTQRGDSGVISAVVMIAVTQGLSAQCFLVQSKLSNVNI